MEKFGPKEGLLIALVQCENQNPGVQTLILLAQ